jgi:hypothetical protein
MASIPAADLGPSDDDLDRRNAALGAAFHRASDLPPGATGNLMDSPPA